MEAKEIKRTGLGAAAFGVAGFALGGPAGAAAGALVGAALARLSASPLTTSRGGALTADRQKLHVGAMRSTRPSEELHELAVAFEREGLVDEAQALRRRAVLRDAPEVCTQRARAVRHALASDDVAAITKIADASVAAGALVAAETLRAHAADVRAAHEAGKSVRPMPDPKVIALAGQKLAQAIYHRGPESREAQIAAVNFLRAREQAPTPELVVQAIRACVEEMQLPAEGQATTADPQEETPAAEEQSPAATADQGMTSVGAEADVAPREAPQEAVTPQSAAEIEASASEQSKGETANG